MSLNKPINNELQDTGERMIPEYHKGKNVYGAHLARYEASLPLIEGKTVLDIACGSGYGTKLISNKANKVYGIDVDPNAIVYAKKHYAAKNIEYISGDGVSIPLKNNSVDIVICYETIEHIEKYEKFMTEINRILKKSGQLLLSTPNEIEYAEGNHFHIHEFEYNELKRLVEKYFKYHADYFQTLWLYSTILPNNLHTTEWEKPINTIDTVALKPEQCIYFLLLCSNDPIGKSIEPLGVIGEHFRQRTLQDRERKYQNIAEKLQEQRNYYKALKKNIKDLENSKAWKLVRFLQKLSAAAKIPANKLKRPK